MVAVLVGVIGLVVGAGCGWLVAGRARDSQREDLVRARTDLAAREAELGAIRQAADRERIDRDETHKALANEFDSLSRDVLRQTIQDFNQSQEQVVKERDLAIDRTLKPLSDQLDELKRSLSDFDKQHVDALGAVKHQAEELAKVQVRGLEETSRLNQLLGRGDQRGHWGEIQLANVLEASGLREHIDFDTQTTTTSESGARQRPDCVVRLPNGTHVAIDAKFPFDAFEASLACEDNDERRTFEAKHARDLHLHVKTLRERAYWESITPAPEFVVCFVPSDAAIGAAFQADPDLFGYAARERVLVVGPATLLSLLWSVAMVVRQQTLAINADQIYDIAAKIYDRIRLVAVPIANVGKALETQVKEYNAMVGSFESRLIVSARQLQRGGGAGHAKALPDLGPVERTPARLDEAKWGLAEGSDLDEAATIIDLDEWSDVADDDEA